MPSSPWLGSPIQEPCGPTPDLSILPTSDFALLRPAPAFLLVSRHWSLFTVLPAPGPWSRIPAFQTLDSGHGTRPCRPQPLIPSPRSLFYCSNKPGCHVKVMQYDLGYR
jgi:hypothetical protein